MNKLELKDVAPYLPYGLTFRYDEEPSEYVMIGLKCNRIKLSEVTEDLSDGWVGYNDGWKPILRPLSDIYYNVTGGKVMNDLDCDLKTVHELWDFYDKENTFELNDLLYKTYQIVLQNHFDVFRLIEKDLAININDLKQ